MGQLIFKPIGFTNFRNWFHSYLIYIIQAIEVLSNTKNGYGWRTLNQK